MATPTTLPSTFVAGDVLTAAQMNNLRGAFRVLQVVSTTKTDTFTTTSTSFTDVTGLSATITPSATSNLVLVLVSMGMSNTVAQAYVHSALIRGSTQIALGDAAGTRTRAFNGMMQAGGTAVNNEVLNFGGGIFLDSPATTAATTYKMQIRVNANTGTVNRNGGDADASTTPRTVSSITLMEISA